MILFKRINLNSIWNFYNVIDRRELECLIAYIEEHKDSNNAIDSYYATLWYDFLCSCSTYKGREELDVQALLVQLEGMLAFLLSRPPKRHNERYDEYVDYDVFKNILRSAFGFKQREVYHYLKKPVKVTVGSRYAKIVTAAEVGDYLLSHKKEEWNDEVVKLIKAVGKKIDAEQNERNKDVFIDFKIFLSSIKEDAQGYYGDARRGFSMFLNVTSRVFADELDVVKLNLPRVVALRNKAAHDGYLDKVDVSNVIKIVLLIATKLCPNIVEIKQRDIRYAIDKLQNIICSGKILRKIADGVKKVESSVVWLGDKKFLAILFSLLIVVLGYYMYNDDARIIDYSSVPKVKRLDLFDRIMTNQLTESYVKRMQKDVVEFRNIEKEVDDAID